MVEHLLQHLIDEIEETHPGLGQLAALSAVATKACKCLLVIAPPGCGKSTVGQWLHDNHSHAFMKDSITRSSLKAYETEFNDFDGLLVFDDVGKIDTEHSRIQTLVTMAELVHGHFVSKDSFQLNIEIDNFHGSAVLNIQPNILKDVVEHPSWHSNLADKSLRYYHMRRATTPNRGPIDVEIGWGLELADVAPYSEGSPIWNKLMQIGMGQWSRPRAMEHLSDMLRAVAAMGGNPEPDEIDAGLLLELIRPMTVEIELLVKRGFGTEASVNVNLFALLVEFASYETITYGLVAADYHMRERQVAYILQGMTDWFEKIGNNPVTLRPTPELKRLLAEAGIR